MDFLDNIKIGKKLIGGFLILALIIAGIGIFGWMNMKSINDGMTTMYVDRTVPLNELGLVYGEFYKMRGDTYKYFLYPDEKATIKQGIQDGVASINSEMDKFRATSLDDAEKTNLSQFDKS